MIAHPGGIPRRAKSDRCPLSFAQERLWFLAQLQPHSPLDSVSAAVRVQGTLDVSVLRRSLEAIVIRHRLAQADPAAHEPMLANSLGNLGYLSPQGF